MKNEEYPWVTEFRNSFKQIPFGIMFWARGTGKTRCACRLLTDYLKENTKKKAVIVCTGAAETKTFWNFILEFIEEDKNKFSGILNKSNKILQFQNENEIIITSSFQLINKGREIDFLLLDEFLFHMQQNFNPIVSEIQKGNVKNIVCCSSAGPETNYLTLNKTISLYRYFVNLVTVNSKNFTILINNVKDFDEWQKELIAQLGLETFNRTYRFIFTGK